MKNTETEIINRSKIGIKLMKFPLLLNDGIPSPTTVVAPGMGIGFASLEIGML